RGGADAGGGDAAKAVVHHGNGELSGGRAAGHKLGIMLAVEPILGRGAALQGEVALVAQPPQNVARTLAVLVINFYDPVLVTHGKQQVSIIGRVNHGVGVGPVRKGAGVGMAVHVQMVECAPDPTNVEVGVEVDQHIAQHVDGPGLADEV